MFDIQINIGNELDHLISSFSSAVDAALQECGEAVAAEEAKRTTGKLSQSFFTKKDGDTQIIDTDKAYAQYVEYGRGAVRAINAKALHFFINGEEFFRKSVDPAAPKPFVQASISAAESRFQAIFDKHLR